MAPSHPRLKARTTKPKKAGFSNDVPPGLHYLLPLDPKSKEFLDLFRSFMLSNDERKTILALSEEDAKVFIDVIDRAFRAAELDRDLKLIAFNVLRKLCSRIGHLPNSYLLSHKFDLSGTPHAAGGFADVRKGSYKGKNVAVKSLRISELDDKMRIRKRFCKEVVMWKNLSHPNVLNLIGVPDTLEDARFSMVSEWMANDDIVKYVRANAGNHLKLLEGAVEGLAYLHHACIVHGDLKGANILITNTNPVSACLADFGFMTIVLDPNLKFESTKNSEKNGGTTAFMAPERLFPSMFGVENDTPTTEADIYAMAMVIYQVLTGKTPFSERTGHEATFQVLKGVRPTKPTNALNLGLSDNVWELLEGCWQTNRQLRPSVRDVLSRVKSAALACGALPAVGGVVQRHDDQDSLFTKFDQLFLGMTPEDQDDIRSCPMERPPSQESIASMPDSLFSKLSETSEAESFITEPSPTSTDALVLGGHSKGESTEDLPAFLFGQTSDHGSHPRVFADTNSRSSTPGSETPTRPWLFRENSGPYPYRNKNFAESSGSDHTLLVDAAPHRRDQLRSDANPASTISTAMTYDSEPHIEEQPVVDPMASTYHFVPDAATINMARAKENPTRQLSRPSSMLSLCSSKSRTIERGGSPQPDDNSKNKSRQSRFRVRQRLGGALDRIADTLK